VQSRCDAAATAVSRVGECDVPAGSVYGSRDDHLVSAEMLEFLGTQADCERNSMDSTRVTLADGIFDCSDLMGRKSLLDEMC
jgi:hypothetical protein